MDTTHNPTLLGRGAVILWPENQTVLRADVLFAQAPLLPLRQISSSTVYLICDECTEDRLMAAPLRHLHEDI